MTRPNHTIRSALRALTSRAPALAGALALAAGLPLSAQDSGVPQAGQEVSMATLLAGANQLPPPARLGLRTHLIREAQQVADAVLVVETPADAALAIGSWAGLSRFPVLIDDGSLLAAENIARFVRAFEPQRVLYLTRDEPSEWPEDPGERSARMIKALGRTLSRTDIPTNVSDIVDKMREFGIGPNGVVVVDPTDDAWVAGLALAAGRMQALAFITPEGGVNGMMSGQDMRSLADNIQQQLKTIGLNWERTGDEIDAVTLVANMPLRVGLGLDGDDEKALTDLIGRHRGGIGNRWAWTGAVFGDAQTALYRATCSLFLSSGSAWLFDGYGRGDPWDLYDATSAGRILDQQGFEAEVHDTPDNRVRDWRRVTARGLDADLALVNSKGMVGDFSLGDGKARPGDIPILHRPLALHIVHSWSARVPASPRSVAGRWLEHGAYAYYGSIDEPYLNAFVPTPRVAGRLVSGLPWGVAVRLDNSPPWKLNVLGDPLATFYKDGTAGTRLDAVASFEDARPMDEIVKEHLKAGRFADAIRALTISGRDEDAGRLAAALLSDRPEAVGNDAAFWMVMPLYRAGRYDALAEAYNRVSPDKQKTLLLQDALWHAGRTALASGPNTKIEGLMRRNLRSGQEEHDAVEVAAFIASRAGTREAAAFLESVSPTIENDRRRNVVTEAVRRFGGPTRP